MTDSPGSGIDLNMMAAVVVGQPTGNMQLNTDWQNAACAPQNCIVDWPQFWPQQPATFAPIVPLQQTHYHFTPGKLSDEDVERVAKRVVELLREPSK